MLTRLYQLILFAAILWGLALCTGIVKTGTAANNTTLAAADTNTNDAASNTPTEPASGSKPETPATPTAEAAQPSAPDKLATTNRADIPPGPPPEFTPEERVEYVRQLSAIVSHAAGTDTADILTGITFVEQDHTSTVCGVASFTPTDRRVFAFNSGGDGTVLFDPPDAVFNGLGCKRKGFADLGGATAE